MSSLRRHIGVLGQIAGFYLIHFLFFGRHFVDGSAILVGDSQIAISLNNLATYTLNTYHEFLWWDPTGLDGYPALVNLTHGWFNYLSPLILPGHVFVWIAISLLHWPLVTAVQVQLFSLAYLSSLIFVVLLSRELIRSPLARLFPPLVFTLGASANQFFMLAQHGPALAPTLAYLFGLIYFWRRRTPSSLFVFMVFLSCFVASINYITFSSHLFPLVLFTILLVVFTPNSLFSAWTALRAAMGTVRGSVWVALGTVSCIVAFVNIGLTLHYFAAEIVRVGDNLKDFSYASEGLAALATPPNWGIAPQRIFLAFNQWFPFDDAYRFALRDEPWQDLFIPKFRHALYRDCNAAAASLRRGIRSPNRVGGPPPCHLLPLHFRPALHILAGAVSVFIRSCPDPAEYSRNGEHHAARYTRRICGAARGNWS